MNTHLRMFCLHVLPTALLFLLMLCVSCDGGIAYARQEMQIPPRVEIPGTQLLKITSSIVEGQEYVLQVHFPRYYDDTTRTFPVAYVLDGQWDFGLVTALQGQLYYDGFVPAVVIVGVTWGGMNPNVDSLRARDYTPSHSDELPQSGGAGKFLSCLKQEIIPFIESGFRVSKTDRTLMGSSFGGLFTLYTMYQETGLFRRYIAASPAILWNNAALSQDEERYFAKTKRLPVRLYMVSGDCEYYPALLNYEEHLKSRNYEGLEMEIRVLENTGHSGSKTEGFSRGLQYIFARPSLKLGPAALTPYEGVYEVNPNLKVRLFVEKEQLMAKMPEGWVQALQAESETDFYVRGQYLFVHFKKDESGTVTGFQLERYGSTQFVKKVE